MRPLADIIGNAAQNILKRMENFSPTEKIEILALMQTMVSIEINRELRAKQEAQQRQPLPAQAITAPVWGNDPRTEIIVPPSEPVQ